MTLWNTYTCSHMCNSMCGCMCVYDHVGRPLAACVCSSHTCSQWPTYVPTWMYMYVHAHMQSVAHIPTYLNVVHTCSHICSQWPTYVPTWMYTHIRMQPVAHIPTYLNIVHTCSHECNQWPTCIYQRECTCIHTCNHTVMYAAAHAANSLYICTNINVYTHAANNHAPVVGRGAFVTEQGRFWRVVVGDGQPTTLSGAPSAHHTQHILCIVADGGGGEVSWTTGVPVRRHN